MMSIILISRSKSAPIASSIYSKSICSVGEKVSK